MTEDKEIENEFRKMKEKMAKGNAPNLNLGNSLPTDNQEERQIMGEKRPRMEDNINNPQHPHVATVLLLDTSGSMSKNINQVNEAVEFFKKKTLNNELARKRCDLAVITFGTDVTVINDFSSIEDFEAPVFAAQGSTSMGNAILKAIELIEHRKAQYRDQGVDYYRPWIWMITDGSPTDMSPGDELWNKVVKKVHEGDSGDKKFGRKFSFYAVGVDSADMVTLRKLSPPTREPLKLKEGKWLEMFEWLSKSQQKISESRMGEQVQMESPVGAKGWAEIST
jgi:uncharacterized protein YegL